MMNCPKCQLLEMRVKKAKDNQIHYECKNCGQEKIVDMKELKDKEV